MHFTASEDGRNLERYLKEQAWLDDVSGESSVFLVKDSDDGIVLFFSIKCGLVFEHYLYDKLDETERQFVDLIIEAKLSDDAEAIESYYSYGEKEFDDVDKLFKIAEKRLDIKNEGKVLNDSNKALKVSKSYSAIEVQHFCKNSNYKVKSGIKVPVGFGVFWEKIVPHIIGITELIGCRFLYLFAADNTRDDEVKKLVKYYKSALKFSEVEDVNVIKPEYDKNCYSLIQEICNLKYNREAVWQEFSDM